MSWENALDALIIDRIHRAEEGRVEDREILALVRDLIEIAPGRPHCWFHCGYGRTLLGLDLPSPGAKEDGACHRWFAFGRLKGHMRRSDDSWVADLTEDEILLADLLAEPPIAAQVLPGLMSTCFQEERFERAIRLLSLMEHAETRRGRDGIGGAPELGILVEAGMIDLLARIERTPVSPEGEGVMRRALQSALKLEHFETLADDDRARFFRALGESHLNTGEWDEADRWFEAAERIAQEGGRTWAQAHFGRALVALRVLDLGQVRPEPRREGREKVLAHLEPCGSEPAPLLEALYVQGILRYETGAFEDAVEDLEKAYRLIREQRREGAAVSRRIRYFLGASLLAADRKEDSRRAALLLGEALEEVVPDLETFYLVHDQLKVVEPKLALRFLDRLDLGRGTSPENLLLVALEYLGLGEPDRALAATERVLKIATDLDHRLEAWKVRLTAHNMKGRPDEAREDYFALHELLERRGALEELENLLLDEALVGQALDHLEIKSELIDIYEEMEGREWDAAQLKLAVARSLRARKDLEQIQQARGLLAEIGIRFPELAKDELEALEKLLALKEGDGGRGSDGGGFRDLEKILGRKFRVLVVGGNERQRRHIRKLEAHAAEKGFEAEWLLANYRSPQKTVSAIRDRLQQGNLDAVILLHWNRHETTEPALDLCRKAKVPARTLYYAGFTSLAVCLEELGKRKVPGNSRAGVD